MYKRITRAVSAVGFAVATASVMLLASSLPVSAAGNYTWITANGLTSAVCPQLASSSTGQYMLCGNNGGNLFTSSDFGANWIEQLNSSNQPWSSVAVSGNANYMYAVAADNSIWKSTDRGVQWTSSTVAGATYLEQIATSSDGKYVIISDSGSTGTVFSSQDFGVTWSSTTPNASASIIKLSMSGSGQYQALAYLGDEIYISSDYGITWSAKSAAGTHSWTTVNVSEGGRYIAAAAGDGTIVRSADYGVTWGVITPSGGQYWNGIVISNDGQTLIASQYYFNFSTFSTGGDLYRSYDAGATWAVEAGVPSDVGWSPVAGSADRSRLVARAITGNQVYVGNNPLLVAAPSVTQPAVSSSSTTPTLADTGSNLWLVYTVAGFTIASAAGLLIQITKRSKA